MRLWRPILLALFLGVVGLLVRSPTTTTPSGTTFTYDVPALAVVDAHPSAPAGAGQGTRVGVREGSASPSVETRGTSSREANPQTRQVLRMTQLVATCRSIGWRARRRPQPPLRIRKRMAKCGARLLVAGGTRL
jgi:hypothetical protein